MTWGPPEIGWAVGAGLYVAINIALHGERHTEKHNGFAAIFGTLCKFGLLYWGGFFS